MQSHATLMIFFVCITHRFCLFWIKFIIVSIHFDQNEYAKDNIFLVFFGLMTENIMDCERPYQSMLIHSNRLRDLLGSLRACAGIHRHYHHCNNGCHHHQHCHYHRHHHHHDSC